MDFHGVGHRNIWNWTQTRGGWIQLLIGLEIDLRVSDIDMDGVEIDMEGFGMGWTYTGGVGHGYGGG